MIASWACVDETEGCCNIWALLDNNCAEKLDIFQCVQLQYLTYVNEVIIMQTFPRQCSNSMRVKWARE